MPIKIERFENTPINSSCYIIKDMQSQRILIVDPGTEDMSEIVDEEFGHNIDYIILTHEHFDHVWGCNDLYNRFKSKIICSVECSYAISERKKNLSVFYDQKGFSVINECVPITNYNNPFKWHNNNVFFYRTSGHSDTSISFVIDKYLFTGDTLIENLKTVTKLKNGSKQELLKSLELYNMLKRNGLIVCPGHGEMFPLDNYDLSKAIK